MSKILITGASGFIGKALSAKLKKQGFDLLLMSSADGDIASAETWQQLLNVEISHVFHLAGKTYVPESWIQAEKFYRANLLGTVNSLEFCKSRNISMTFVSAYVYGHPESLPIKENSKITPSNPYALSKRLAEEVCEFYALNFDLPITVLRPFNVYGVGQDEKFLIPSIIKQVLTEQRIVVQDLEPKRDYIYLEDLLTALLLTLKQPKGYRVYNIGSGSSLSVKEVIDIVQAVAKTNKEVVSKSIVRTNELMNVVADISNAENKLGWHPHYSFQDGIENMLSLGI